MSVLEAHDLCIRFGGVQANLDVSIAVDEYEIVGVIGPNGAGKTTLFNMITGFYTPDRGRIVYRGEEITYLPVHQRAALGLGRTFQNVGLVKGTTVRENLITAQYLQTGYGTVSGMLGSRSSVASERRLRARADLLAEALGLSDFLDQQVAGLPYGTLKRIEIATALATDPDVLLLDEPSSGMGPEEAHRLGDDLLELRQQVRAVDRHDRAPRAARDAGLRLRLLPRLRPAPDPRAAERCAQPPAGHRRLPR